MQRKVFDSSVSAILDNLSKLNDDFAQDTVFPDTSSLAKTLQSLAGQVNNLRVFLVDGYHDKFYNCLLYTSPSPRDLSTSRMPSSA